MYTERSGARDDAGIVASHGLGDPRDRCRRARRDPSNTKPKCRGDDAPVRNRVDGNESRPLRPAPTPNGGLGATSTNQRAKKPSSLFAIGRSLESGDSGTAIFDQRTFRLVPAVIGVAMATTFDANGKTKVGLVTRIDTHRDFIARTMLQAIFAR